MTSHKDGEPFIPSSRELDMFKKKCRRRENVVGDLLCPICKEKIGEGEVVIKYHLSLYHYPRCFDVLYMDIPDSVLDERDLFFIKNGYWKEVI